MARKRMWWAALGLIVLAVLSACTSESKSSSPGRQAVNNAMSVESGAAGSAPTPAVGAPNAQSKPGGVDAAAVTAPGPSVIRTADMTVTATGVSAAADRARAIVTGVGGSVDGDDRTAGTHPSATMTLRVPPAQLDDVLSRLAALGKEQTRHLSTQDVTTQVADVDSRVRSAVAAISRLRDLYARATRVADIIDIESQLTQRESDLESLEAQQRALAGQIAMATVTLSLVTPATPPAHRAHQHGFVGGLLRGWHAFTAAVAVIVTGAGAALPFVLLVGAAVGIWLTIRRRRPPTAEPVS